MKKIAVILAGCGRLDGSEVHESVLTLLSVVQAGASYQCFSIDSNQYQVINHVNRLVVSHETRNMLVESARIARGDIKSINELDVNKYDGLIIPGGNGVAYNLFDFAIMGKDFSVNPQLKSVCNLFTNNSKPVGFICISPVMVPKIYEYSINLTIGNDSDIAHLLETLGATHHICKVEDICVDMQYKIVTTPAYMLAHNILEVYTGINRLVNKVIELS